MCAQGEGLLETRHGGAPVTVHVMGGDTRITGQSLSQSIRGKAMWLQHLADPVEAARSLHRCLLAPAAGRTKTGCPIPI